MKFKEFFYMSEENGESPPATMPNGAGTTSDNIEHFTQRLYPRLKRRKMYKRYRWGKETEAGVNPLAVPSRMKTIWSKRNRLPGLGGNS